MKKKGKIILASIVSAFSLVVLAATIIADKIAEPILTIALGRLGETKNLGTSSIYKTDEELQNAREDISSKIEEEGSVLLKNDNETLPLKKNKDDNVTVSIFSQHAHEILASGSGSGSIGDAKKNLKEVLNDEGITVNEDLWNFYLNNDGKSLGNGPALAGGNSITDWSINEYPVNKYPSTLADTYKNSQAAIVVISRTGGEGGDLPTDMSSYGGTSNQHYLELSQEEKDLLTLVKNNFSKVVVLLNTNNDFELGFLEEYNISSCLLIGGVGMGGLSGVAKVLAGEANPSGHLNDTLVYDNFSHPSTQNFGDFKYTNHPEYSYVVYSEGIYVGYRYFETAYADKMMNKTTIDFNYDTTVTYPFGYGLSYTTFTWSDYEYSYNSKSDTFEFKVKVTNNGTREGKDVVSLYMSAPYVHDKTTIEKSFVELKGFKKTKSLKSGESEVISISIPKSDLKCYDEKVNKTYVLEEGNYNFTLASDTHKATNNILKKLGYSSTGDASFVSEYNQAITDTTTYSKDSNTGNTVTNLFDSATYDGMTTLSRNDFSKVYSLKVSNLNLSDKDYTQASKKGKEASLNPDWNKEVEEITVGASNDIQLVDLVQASYDDERWDKLVENISKSNLQKLFATAGYKTNAIENIGKPEATDTDGPAGLQSFVGGASTLKAYGYPTENVLACTYNVDLAKELGEMVCEDALWSNINGWYAPGMDTHRTPFGGRNFEYYSEDGLLAGKFGAAVVQGAKEKGLYCFIKHFALNEQDTNRGTTLHTWASEQAMREIYLKPFEISVKEGGADALMTSLNCIGVTPAVCNYNLITKLLKEEWGFKGFVITDYLPYDSDLILATLYAGGDGMLSTYGIFSDKSNSTLKQLQRAAKSILYTISRSNAMNPLLEGKTVSVGFPVFRLLFIIVDAVLIAGSIVLILVLFLKKKKVEKEVD